MEGMPVRTALVTGGASGIGRAIAARLRSDGHRVAIIDLSPTDEPNGFVADVADRAQVEAAVVAVHEALGPITVLVNAAGMERFRRFHNLSFEDWSRVVDVNLNGVFHTIQTALPDMVEAGWGRIVNISSSSTHSGQQFMTSYVAAKSAVNGLTKSLALEYGPSGITVNGVAPGFVDTPMLRHHRGQHRTHARPAGWDARGHRGRVRVPDLRGCRLHHGPNSRRQRRTKNLRETCTTATSSSSTDSGRRRSPVPPST
jgi:NAD(P)-dependent dehydrogenase (short-subunit alcohol dehydrogenase family)